MSAQPGLATSPPSPSASSQTRRARKHRPLVVPADTLLTFSRYHPPPRSESEYGSVITRSSRRTANSRRPEQFVQANYRFAVDPHFEQGYVECTSLADAVVPWEAVEIVFMEQAGDCPICLHPFRCPIVTPCGHAFDHACMLQHQRHSADPAGHAKCPLCSSPVFPADLRPCSFRDVEILEVGLPYAMRLLSREKGSMLPNAQAGIRRSQIPKDVSLATPFYSRLAFGDERYLLKLINNSINNLREALQEDPGLAALIDPALSALKTRKNVVRARRSASEREHARNGEASNQTNSRHINLGTESSGTDGNLWYFYQARDAQNVFLHPLNHRCLSTEFNADFANADHNIEGKVIQIERFTMNEKLRKRYKFLGHLPEGCEFSFVELDLSPILSPSTLASHKTELRERESIRRKKEIAGAKEDRILERRRSESLQDYFHKRDDAGASHCRQAEKVDSRDTQSFPALGSAAGKPDGNVEEDPRCSISCQATSPCPSKAAAWGSEISSYSSVTSNMGLFPTLSGTAPLPSSPQRQPESWRADVTWGASNSTGPSAALAFSGAEIPARNGNSSSIDGKKGKRSQGKTTILLSNAGFAQRR